MHAVYVYTKFAERIERIKDEIKGFAKSKDQKFAVWIWGSRGLFLFCWFIDFVFFFGITFKTREKQLKKMIIEKIRLFFRDTKLDNEELAGFLVVQ